MRKISILLLSLICCLNVFAQQPIKVQGDVPLDQNVRTGKLPNGLTYYIRKNTRPEHRAELRLVVNAGSILENESQQGLAHLNEHMCFDGTKNFQKSAIIDFLESSGMTFGADLNAYTSFDETVYMLQIPTDTPAVFNKGMQILQDWSHNVTFDNPQIDKERKVVVEEWRLGRGADERMARQFYPVLFNNSQYANRITIGKREIIEGAPYDTIKQFYRDWYRPDLMAVVVVGDVDVDQVEKTIKDEFTPLTNPQNERKRIFFPVPDADGPMAKVCTDKEATYTAIQLMFKQPVIGVRTVNDYRETMKRLLITSMLNQRFAELSQKSDPPFAGAESGYTDIGRTKAAYINEAAVKDGGIERGLKAMLDENNRMKKFGFTSTELDREKKELLRAIETQFNEKDKTESRSYTGEYVSLFLSGEPSPGIDWEYQMWKQALPTITLDEVNQMAAGWVTDGKNAVIIVTAPQKDGVSVPTEDQVKQIFKNEQQTSVTAYSDKVVNKPLMDKAPKAGKIVKENTIAPYNVTEWTLSNGARVILKPTDFKNDEILFSAYSFGGTSLYPDKDNISAKLSADIINNSGIGPYDANELSKYLSDKIANITPSIGEETQSFSGKAAPKDLETMLQLLYLYVTAPKKDTTGYKSFLTQELSEIQNSHNRPESALGDTINTIMHQYNYRYRPMTEKVLNEADLNRAYDIYKDRFSDGGEFTYVFVGNFKTDEIKPLIEKYIGGLPTQKRNENFKDLGIAPPKGTVTRTVLKGTEPKSAVEMLYSGPFVYNRHNRMDVYALVKLADIKLRETLRAQMSGVYGVGVWPELHHYPQQTYQMGVEFGCAPENVDKLVAATFSVLDSIKQFGCNDKDLVKVKEELLKERETNLKENNFWLSALSSSYQNGESVTELQDFDKQINALTSNDFKRLATQYYSKDNFAKFVLNPQSN